MPTLLFTFESNKELYIVFYTEKKSESTKWENE